MPKHILVLAVVLASFSQAAMAGQSAPPPAVSFGLQRTTVLVTDIEKSVDFYQRIGLLKASDTITKNTDQGGVFGAADLPLTADSKSGRLVVMQTGAGQGQLGLLAYTDPPLPSARGNLVGVGIGDIVMTIEVPDIQGVSSRLAQIGTRFQRNTVRFTQINADGTQQTGQHFLAFDPDGHMVEVSQLDRR
jgi:catechol 2,3-dioxygenase-like lactoylglutathione lyase family enzyme